MNLARGGPASCTRPRPVCTVLYNLLELDDWKVGVEVVKAAYKKVAVKNHPDKVPNCERGEATERMQRINAAKEVLLDPTRRMAYDRAGKLPWAL